MTRNATAAGRQPGLTLIEILATIFVLGMGLIMVGAAFPVGIDQMRRTKEDTNSAQLARSTFNMIRAQGFALSVAATGVPGITPMSDVSTLPGPNPSYGLAYCDPSTPAALSTSWALDLISNPNALAYGNKGFYDRGNLITGQGIANGSLVCIPVFTRMVVPASAAANTSRVDGAGVPLFRVTLVVVKKTSQMDASGVAIPLFSRATVTSGGSLLVTVPAGTAAANVNVDDGVLISYGSPPTPNGGGTDYQTGAVFRIVDCDKKGSGANSTTVTLDDFHGISQPTDALVFFNFVAAYYAYIGG